MDVVAGEPAAAHADDVEPLQHGALADREAERNDVGRHPAHAGDHGALADADELMDRGRSTEHHAVAERDMAAENGVVGEDHIVADVAVVPDMRPDHEEAAVPNPGGAAAVFGA